MRGVVVSFRLAWYVERDSFQFVPAICIDLFVYRRRSVPRSRGPLPTVTHHPTPPTQHQIRTRAYEPEQLARAMHRHRGWVERSGRTPASPFPSGLRPEQLLLNGPEVVLDVGVVGVDLKRAFELVLGLSKVPPFE